MKAREIMQPYVMTANEFAPAQQVAAQMVVGSISGFPITNDDGALVGIVTELDLIRALRAGKDLAETLVEDVMTRDVITVHADDTVEHIMDILQKERVIRVLVLHDGQMVGIVSRGDILKAAIGQGTKAA